MDPTTVLTQRSTTGALIANGSAALPVGAAVRLVATGPQGDDPVTLAEGIVNLDGSFDLTDSNDAAAVERRALFGRVDGVAASVVVDDAGGKPLASVPAALDGSPVVVALPPDAVAPLGDKAWGSLVASLPTSGTGRLSDVSRAIADPTTGALTATVRLQAQVRLEQDFLDPGGVLRAVGPAPSFALAGPSAWNDYVSTLGKKAATKQVGSALTDLRAKLDSFPNMAAVDWAIPAGVLGSAEFTAELAKLTDAYRIRAGDWDPASESPRDDVLGYRDYLRGVWTWLATQEYPSDHRPTLDADEAIDELNRRFHQDFRTTDVAAQPADRVLAAVVTSVLTANPDDFGLGHAAADLPSPDGHTDREHLDALVALTGLDSRELAQRYRLDLARAADAVSSPVQENIAALRGFFSDGFMAYPDADPHQVVPGPLAGRPPFYLQYEEWLAQTAPFYPQNFLDLLGSYGAVLTDERAQHLKSMAVAGDVAPSGETFGWFIDVWSLGAAIVDARDALARDEYGLAQQKFGLLADQVEALLRACPQQNPLDDKTTTWLTRWAGTTITYPSQFTPMWELTWPIRQFGLAYGVGAFDVTDYYVLDAWRQHWRNSPDQLATIRGALVALATMVLPIAVGDCAVGLGDYATANHQYGRVTRMIVAQSVAADMWQPYPNSVGERRVLHQDGALLYGTDVRDDASIFPDPYDPGAWGSNDDQLPITHRTARSAVPDLVPWSLARAAELRHAEAMLEWADALYRAADPDSTARAREGYKAALVIHGEQPPITPTWGRSGLTRLRPVHENPALVAHRARALRGLTQIDAGLNYLGLPDDTLPVLRYSVLRQEAERAASAATTLQQELLRYTQAAEQQYIDRLQASALRIRASLQSAIAGEQLQIANDGVTQAQAQVDRVNQQITDKEQEIADHQSLFGQFGDYFSGMSSFFGNSAVQSTMGGAAGLSSSGDAAAATAGAAGAGVVGVFAAFVIMSYMTMSSMTDAANRRQTELHNLQTRDLGAARAQLDGAHQQVRVAALQGAIAANDSRLAADLIGFDDQRVLSPAFWTGLIRIGRRLMRRRLEVGARFAWLAERALAFEQDRTLGIVRFDYPDSLGGGLAGADLLIADLAELDVARLSGARETVPLTWTVSLARDRALAFAALRTSNEGTFSTTIADLTRAYPGTYGHRIRAVSVTAAAIPGAGPIRGDIANDGLSATSRSDGTIHPLIRPMDAQPISEFSWRADRDLFQRPDEALSPFEGSGVDTTWRVSLPAAANAGGLAGLSDVLITFDIAAYYSPTLRAVHEAEPEPVAGMVLVSAGRQDAAVVDHLHGEDPTVNLSVEVPAVDHATLDNLVVIVPAARPVSPQIHIATDLNPDPVGVRLTDGVAMSLAGDGGPVSPLGAFTGHPLPHTVMITIVRAESPDIDWSSITDVMVGLDYHVG